MITSPYSIIRLAQIDTDPCHLRWTTGSSLQECDAVSLSGCWWSKRSLSSSGSSSPRKLSDPKDSALVQCKGRVTQQHSWTLRNTTETASNLAYCGITGGNVRFIHLVIASHMNRSHTCEHFIIGSFKTLTLQHTSVMRTQRGWQDTWRVGN